MSPTAIPPIPWRRLVVWFIASRVLIWTIAGLSTLVVSPGKFFTPPSAPLGWLNHWDASWYLHVIQHGYNFDPSKMSSVNFLPLYPLLVRAIAWALPSVEIAAYLVSNAFAFGAAALLWRLSFGLNQRASSADGAVQFFFFGPVGFFFATIYSEATFIFCVLAALLAARHQRWLFAGILGALASCTRSVGVLLVVPLLVEFLQHHPLRTTWRSWPTWRGLLYCALPLAGLLLYTLYLGWRFDDPRAYLISQGYGGKGYSYFWDTFASRHFDAITPFYRWWFGGAVVTGVALLLAGALLRLPLSFTAFALTCCLLYFSTKTLECMPRFLSVVAPFYSTLGEIKTRWPAAGEALFATSAALLALSVILFVNGYWFT